MILSSIRHAWMDCSLCKRLHGSTIESTKVEKRRRVERIDPSKLILPEQIYKPYCIPWYDLPCGHSYHAPCLAVLNPAKYSNISYIKDSPDTINIDEVHCLDCNGRGINNCTFHATTNEPDVRIDDGKAYINIKNAFERADKDVAIFIERYDISETLQVNINSLLNNYVDTNRKSIEEINLPDLRNKIINCIKLITDTIEGISADHEPLDHPYIFLKPVSAQRINPETVTYLELTEPIEVAWDNEKLQQQRILIDALNIDALPMVEHIARVNRLANPIQDHLHGDYSSRSWIDETDPIVTTMLYATIDPRKRGLCVLNRHGEKKRVLTFEDFPIRENTGTCSISGGRKTRKYKTIMPF